MNISNFNKSLTNSECGYGDLNHKKTINVKKQKNKLVTTKALLGFCLCPFSNTHIYPNLDK